MGHWETLCSDTYPFSLPLTHTYHQVLFIINVYGLTGSSENANVRDIKSHSDLCELILIRL